MEKDTRTKFATLLRAAAARTISEDEFWKQFNALVHPFADPIAGMAHETATHYWGSFHSKNAEGLEMDWSATDLKRKLADI